MTTLPSAARKDVTVDYQGTARERRKMEFPRITTSWVSWSIFAIVMALILVRIPQTKAYLDQQVPLEAPADMEPELVELSVSVALLLGVVAFMMVLGIYLSVASYLERHLFKVSLLATSTPRIGLFTGIVGVTVLFVQLWALIAGAMPEPALRFLPVLGVTVLTTAAFLFATRSQKQPKRGLVIVLAMVFGCAIAVF
ncbi:hypothetical protein [Neomicrococcus lactis]|uniref:Uncharacterized protein n=1 Tax=Neomicrococcus lactis TaxID=732241 RepID=A0A7W8YBY5_9MICC|nr:hypothetical protein [Neomicrococcus lactis]MBB5598576.1 hypothetical protein [Neomicrococcus lactis]